MGKKSKADTSNYIYTGVDIMKCVAAAAVAVIHIHPFKTFSAWADFCSIVMCRFAVPFFFIAGSFFFFKKMNKTADNQKKQCLLKYIKRILLLFGFWFAVNLLVLFLCGEKIQFLNMVKKMLLAQSAYRGAWYLIATIYGTLIVYFLSQKMNNRGLFLVGTVFFVFSVLACSYLGFFKELAVYNAYLQYKGIFGIPYNGWPVGIIYIVIGKLFADAKENRLFSNEAAWIGFFLFFILNLLELCTLKRAGVLVANDCGFALLPLSVCLFQVVITVKGEKNATFAFLRAYSTITYFSHFIWLKIIPMFWQFNNITLYFVILALCALETMLILWLKKYVPVLQYSY